MIFSWLHSKEKRLMKPFYLKLFLTFFALLIVFCSHSQINKNQNNFSLKLNIPVIIDEEIKTIYVPEKMQDKFQEFHDKKTSISFGANNSKLEYAGNQFRGTWENNYFPHDKITIRGTVSEDHMLLESMTVDYQMNTEDNYRKESEIISLHFENVPMYNGNCLFDKAISKVELNDYRYSTTEISRDYYTRTHTKTVKAIDYDEIPREPKLASWKFRIQLKMDGPPSYKIDVENVRGADPNWVPPLFDISDSETSMKPRSIGIYENPPSWILAGSVNTITHYFLRISGYKVFERKGKSAQKIQGEQKLSESGLVREETKIKNLLLKEEIALITNYKAENKILECTVASASGEKRVEAFPVDEENYGFLITVFCLEIKKAVDELLKHSGE